MRLRHLEVLHGNMGIYLDLLLFLCLAQGDLAS